MSTIAPYFQTDSVSLYLGEALAVLSELPDASVDALITDPPYSSGGMTRGDRAGGTINKYVNNDSGKRAGYSEFAGDTRDQRAYQYWCAMWLAECLRIVKPGGVACLFTDWRQLPTTTDALQAGGFVWRGIVPWWKPGARPAKGRFTAACEYVVWGSAGPMATTEASACLPGFYQALSPRDREHLAQKPVEVMRDLVKIAPAGGVVLDPFMGAGTTGVAAVLEGRRFVGFERVPTHAEASERRIRASLGLHSEGAVDILNAFDSGTGG